MVWRGRPCVARHTVAETCSVDTRGKLTQEAGTHGTRQARQADTHGARCARQADTHGKPTRNGTREATGGRLREASTHGRGEHGKPTRAGSRLRQPNVAADCHPTGNRRITRTPESPGQKGTFLLCWEGGHFYFALTPTGTRLEPPCIFLYATSAPS